MKPIAVYILQVIICSGILYGYYHLFLRNKKIHQYNRFYLLAATVVSLLIPFVKMPLYFTEDEASSSFMYKALNVFSGAEGENITVTATPTSFTNYLTLQNCLLAIYILVACLILVRFITGIGKILRLLQSHNKEKFEGLSFINTNEPGTPFSFFTLLFWNKKISIHSEKGQQIFRHEWYHIQQKHSHDIIFTELLTAVLWINPFFFLIKKEIKTIHEFLADQFATKEQTNLQYAELLLMQAFDTQYNLVNPFFQNQIKRRINMITNTNTSTFKTARKVTGTLLTLVLSVLLSCQAKKEAEEKAGTNPSDSTEITNTNSAFQKDQPIEGEKNNGGEIKEVPVIDSTIKTRQSVSNDPNNKGEVREVAIDKTNKIFAKVEIEAAFKGGAEAWRTFLQRNLNALTPVDNGAPAGTYTVLVQFIVDANGKVRDVKPLTNHGYGMEKEAVRVISKGPDWLAAIQNGHAVSSYRKQPVTFKVTEQ